mmetsp:Transcript_51252/g.116742  ORF Transcript_51252/g.116742 Transcript_51252/m.116742 type:complete len:220 (-) Transcript_51252:3061-3720(-)
MLLGVQLAVLNLGSDAHGAGVQVALPHHVATHGNQWSSGEPEELSAEQRSNNHIATVPQLAVGLQRHTPAQTVEHESLVGLGQAEFPRAPSVLDSGPSGRPGASVVAGDQDVISLALGDTCCDDTHSHFGHQLHAHIRSRVGILQIKDQLGQILNGIDVVVRGRRNQPNTGGGLSGLGDVFQNLPPRQLTALSRLRPLRHLDLQLISICQIINGHTKPP